MTSFRIRPRFKKETDLTEQQIRENITKAIERTNAKCSISGNIPGYITIRIKPEDRHFWSPQLNITIEEKEDETHINLIRGLYGPNPQVWAFIFFSYAVLGVAAFFILMMGFSQWSLGKSADILWGVPVVAILAFGLYIISQFGQKLGVDQTYTIHHVFEEALHSNVKIS